MLYPKHRRILKWLKKANMLEEDTKTHEEDYERIRENYRLDAPGRGLPHISAEYLEMGM